MAGRPDSLEKRISKWFSEYLNLFLRYTASAFGIALRLIVIFIGFMAVVATASFIYWSFYWMIIPKAYQSLPVHFDYGQDHPVAYISLTHKQYKLHDNVKFYHKLEEALLKPYEMYDVVLEFEAYETKVNRDCGVLSFTSDIHGFVSQNKTNVLARSIRSVSPLYRSPIVWMTRKLMLMGPLVLGWIEESSSHSVYLFEEYFETTRFKASHVEIALYGEKYHMKRAAIKFYIKLQGMRWILYHYFFTSAFVGISQITFTLVIGLLMFYYFIFVVDSTNEENEHSTDSQSIADDSVSVSESNSGRKSS